MLLSQAITDPTKETKLFHPEIGNIIWRNDPKGEHGWYLAFDNLAEKNKPLIVDDLVIWDNKWTVMEDAHR